MQYGNFNMTHRIIKANIKVRVFLLEVLVVLVNKIRFKWLACTVYKQEEVLLVQQKDDLNATAVFCNYIAEIVSDVRSCSKGIKS